MPLTAADKHGLATELAQQYMQRKPRDWYMLEKWFTKRPGLIADLDPGTVNQAALRLYSVADKDFILSGTNAATANSNLNVSSSGGMGLTLSCAGAANDSVALVPATAINSVELSGFNTMGLRGDRQPFCTWVFAFESNGATDIEVAAGLKTSNSADASGDANQAIAHFDLGHATLPTKFRAVTSLANVDDDRVVESSPTVLPATKTKYFCVNIALDADRYAHVEIDGVYGGKGGKQINATTALLPIIAMVDHSGTSAVLYPVYMNAGRKLNP